MLKPLSVFFFFFFSSGNYLIISLNLSVFFYSLLQRILLNIGRYSYCPLLLNRNFANYLTMLSFSSIIVDLFWSFTWLSFLFVADLLVLLFLSCSISLPENFPPFFRGGCALVYVWLCLSSYLLRYRSVTMLSERSKEVSEHLPKYLHFSGF